MIKRKPGEYTTHDTRAESHEKVDKQKRYRQIKEVLIKPMTAKEVAVMLYKKGYTPSDERNYSAPRLTELAKKGEVDVIGKKKCEYTGKTVALYERIM